MRNGKTCCIAISALSCLLLLIQIAQAGSLMVAPTGIVLSSSRAIGILYLTNQSDKPVSAQISGFDWSQPDGKDSLASSADLIVSPPVVRIVAGGKQIIRLKARAGDSGSFRVLVRQLPEAPDQTFQGVNVLLQFSLPVFVENSEQTPASLVWDARLDQRNELIVSAQNAGQRHARLTQISIRDDSGRERAVLKDLSYVLPQSRRIWTVAAAGVAANEHLSIDARDGDRLVSSGADIVAHR